MNGNPSKLPRNRDDADHVDIAAATARLPMMPFRVTANILGVMLIRTSMVMIVDAECINDGYGVEPCSRWYR